VIVLLYGRCRFFHNMPDSCGPAIRLILASQRGCP
jgi:hypothetical protein